MTALVGPADPSVERSSIGKTRIVPDAASLGALVGGGGALMVAIGAGASGRGVVVGGVITVSVGAAADAGDTDAPTRRIAARLVGVRADMGGIEAVAFARAAGVDTTRPLLVRAAMDIVAAGARQVAPTLGPQAPMQA